MRCFFVFLSLIVSLPVIPVFAQTYNETLSIVSYYPSPNGVYRTLRLYPTTQPTTGVDQGSLYYNRLQDVIKYRNATGAWVNITGDSLWAFSGTDIYNVNTGRVGIGTNAPTQALDVNGDIRATGAVTAASMQASGTITALNLRANNNVTVTNAVKATGGMWSSAYWYFSDRSLKKNIRPLSDSLDRVTRLQGKSFQWKRDNRQDVGLVAQDVEKVFPELVSTNPENGMKSVEYGNLIAVLIEAVKEQQAQIQELKTEVAGLKNKK